MAFTTGDGLFSGSASSQFPSKAAKVLVAHPSMIPSNGVLTITNDKNGRTFFSLFALVPILKNKFLNDLFFCIASFASGNDRWERHNLHK